MRKDHEIDLAYVGFAKLTAKLAAKGAKNPAALAAAIGRRKYGAKKFNKAAASGVPLKPKKKKKLVASVSLATPSYLEDIELGKFGSEWKHGYIPENAAAVALKNHKMPGGSSSSSSKVKNIAGRRSSKSKAAPKAGGLNEAQKRGLRGSHGTVTPRKSSAMQRADAVAEAERTGHVGNASMSDLAKNRSDSELKHIASSMPNTPEGRVAKEETARRARLAQRTQSQTPVPGKHAVLPAGRKVTAHELTHSGQGEIRDAETGRIVSTGHSSKLAATRKANAHNAEVDKGISETPEAAKARIKKSMESYNRPTVQPRPSDQQIASLRRAEAERKDREMLRAAGAKKRIPDSPASARRAPVEPLPKPGTFGPKAKDGKSSAQVENAKKMFGSDMSKWSTANVKAAAKLGDASAIAELARRADILAKRKGRK